MFRRTFMVFALVGFVAGGAAVQAADLQALASAAEIETAPLVEHTLKTNNGAVVSLKSKAYKWDRAIIEALKEDADTREAINQEISQLAVAETNASIYAEGMSIPAGTYTIGFERTAYDWYIVITNAQGQRILEELAPMDDMGDWTPRLMITFEPGDLANDAIFVVQYGTQQMRIPITVAAPSGSTR